MMDKLFLLVMLQLGTMAWSRANTTEAPRMEERKKIADMVNELCPLTDICAANATNAELNPNGDVGRGRVSCCQGCSCHPDCKDKGNCCYPDDYNTTEDTSSSRSHSECLYTRIGQPENINALIPAFKTIIAPPADGCVDRRPIRVSPDIILEPTCNDIDVTPFGWYFPVYSKQTDEIYKNILCARCHGVRDVESFKPLLVCSKKDRKTKTHTSLTESLGFLETRALSPRCYIDFKFKDIGALNNKRCYKHIIKKYTSDIISTPLHHRSFSVDFGIIQNLCESSFNAPTVNAIDGRVYKNVFCSLCGKASAGVVLLFCIDQLEARTTDDSFIYFLNPTVMHTIDKASIPRIKSEICLNQFGPRPDCRRIYCSTGKIRNSQGDCGLVGNFLAATGVQFAFKLSSKEQIALNEKNFMADSKHLAEIILKSNPWPKYWKIQSIKNRKNISVCDEKAITVIDVSTERESTEMIYRDIENSINQRWTIDWRNETFILEQSFLEYKITPTSINGKMKYRPSWQVHQTNIEPVENVFKCGPMEWDQAYLNTGNLQTAPFLNKLCLCNQIQLQPDEIILGPNNTYLTSNLTKRPLHDNEFDLIEDAEGFHAMVCLEDTIFATNKTNGANSLPMLELAVLILVYLVYRM